MNNSFVGPGLMSYRRSQRSTSIWTNPARAGADRFKSVFVLAITSSLEARAIVERQLAAVAIARGLRGTRSIDFYPGSLGTDSGPSKEELWAKIQSLGCDAIFTVSLLNVKSEQRYVPGQAPYAPYPLHPFYGSFEPYYGTLQPVISKEGYYVLDKTYFLEGNVFDAATGQIQWSMQSIACNPSDLECFSKEYALLLVDQLNKPNGLQP